jgi:hypothetical protein
MFYKESVMKLNLELDQYKDLKKTKVRGIHLDRFFHPCGFLLHDS